MKKILFACDLDNTLIFSKRHARAEDICIELNKGKEQGYMTPQAISLLQSLQENVQLVPVTTRSVEQYERISWSGCTPRFAVTTNGALLLDSGAAEPEWLSRSREYVSQYAGELSALSVKLSASGKFIRVRIVDEMYLFAYTRDDVDISRCAAEFAPQTSLDTIYSGRKIYFLPPRFNKGDALSRLAERFQPDITISAGDSRIDVPMLNLADIALVPAGFPAERLSGAGEIRVCGADKPFSEFVLEQVISASEIVTL